MKKVAAILLILVLVLSLASCAASSGSDVQTPTNVTTGDNSSAEDTAEDSGQTDEQVIEDSVQQEYTLFETSAATEATIEETVLLDESGVKITAKSLETDNLMGTEIQLLIENNSGKNLTFQCRNTSVNGYMVDGMMSVDVVDGKKANDSLTFLDSDFELCGITSIADIELGFYIYDTDTWDTYLESDLIQIKTSVSDTHEYSFDDSGDVAYDGNDVKVIIKGLAEDESIFGPSIMVYIENNSDRNITVQTRDVSINGFMIDGMFSCDVIAGKHAIDTITFFESDLEDNEIIAIENVELSFCIYDADSWDDIADSEVVYITFG